jgi:hypothetical protein
LLKMLAHGLAPMKDIQEAAEANCISAATLRRAKDDLKIEAKKGKGDLKQGWLWELPALPARWDRET